MATVAIATVATTKTEKYTSDKEISLVGDVVAQCFSPPRCINGNQQIAWGQPDKMLGGNLRRTSISSRGSRNTPSRFILQKPELSAGTDESSWLAQLRFGQTLPF